MMTGVYFKKDQQPHGTGDNRIQESQSQKDKIS